MTYQYVLQCISNEFNSAKRIFIGHTNVPDLLSPPMKKLKITNAGFRTGVKTG